MRRHGTEQEISSEDLLPGDICLLESGNRVPADIRLLDTKNLFIDESLLTGESQAVTKETTQLTQNVVPLFRSRCGIIGS